MRVIAVATFLFLLAASGRASERYIIPIFAGHVVGADDVWESGFAVRSASRSSIELDVHAYPLAPCARSCEPIRSHVTLRPDELLLSDQFLSPDFHRQRHDRGGRSRLGQFRHRLRTT